MFFTSTVRFYCFLSFLLCCIVPDQINAAAAVTTSATGIAATTPTGLASIKASPEVSDFTLGEAADAERQDLPFFRFISIDGTEIYILGSQHTIPLQALMDPKVIREIDRIVSLNPILYMEHQVTNRAFLDFLIDHSEEAGKLGPLSKELQKLIEEIKTVDIFKSWEGKGLLITPSGIPFAQVLKASTWLAAGILGTHANILSYAVFGGMEDDIERKFKEEVRYLETPEEALHFLKESASSDAAYNESWLAKSITMVTNLAPYSPDNPVNRSVRKALEQQMLDMVELFTWKVIEEGSPPASAIQRNNQWVKVIFAKHTNLKPVSLTSVTLSASHAKTTPPSLSASTLNSKTDTAAKSPAAPTAAATVAVTTPATATAVVPMHAHKPQPLFIIVGPGHFIGGANVSFLSIFLKELGASYRAQRFTNAGTWVGVVIP